MAWHPKSSIENERTTVVISASLIHPVSDSIAVSETEKGRNGERKILFRQIAGALARRIVFYGKENDSVKQGEQCGFIKFGSRVDMLLPLSTKINVKLNENVAGGVSVIAII